MIRALCALFLLCVIATKAIAADRPNIIVIMADDMGYGDTGATGNRVIRTPNLDRFASESASLSNYYVSPVCSPTRVSLMTGMNATRHHVTTWTHPDIPQDPGNNNVAHLDDPHLVHLVGLNLTRAWTTRSIAEAVVSGAVKICPHSEQTRLEVITTLRRS